MKNICQARIAYNGSAVMMFCDCDKGMRSVPTAVKMLRRKPAQETQPNCGFPQHEPPKRIQSC